MNESAMALVAWQSFFVIVGSSAGALTGLQFVVLTLIADAGVTSAGGETLAAFGSPNVFHFCAALLVSAILTAPWKGLGPPGAAIAAGGAYGVFYVLLTMWRARRQRDYQPVLEDWVWHVVLPALAYAALLHSGIVLGHAGPDTQYVLGGATLLLIFVGIHNAWDTVTYVTIQSARRRLATPAAPEPAAPSATPAGAAPPAASSPERPPASRP